VGIVVGILIMAGVLAGVVAAEGRRRSQQRLRRARKMARLAPLLPVLAGGEAPKHLPQGGHVEGNVIVGGYGGCNVRIDFEDADEDSDAIPGVTITMDGPGVRGWHWWTVERPDSLLGRPKEWRIKTGRRALEGRLAASPLIPLMNDLDRELASLAKPPRAMFVRPPLGGRDFGVLRMVTEGNPELDPGDLKRMLDALVEIAEINRQGNARRE
jgi:hypothetical protein